MNYSVINRKIQESEVSAENAVELLEDIEDSLTVAFFDGEVTATVRAEFIIPLGYDLKRNEVCVGLFTYHDGDIYSYDIFLNLNKLTDEDIQSAVHDAYHGLFKLVCGLRVVK